MCHAQQLPPQDLAKPYEFALVQAYRLSLLHIVQPTASVSRGGLSALASLAGHPEVGYLLDLLEQLPLTCPGGHEIHAWFDDSARMVVSADFRW